MSELLPQGSLIERYRVELVLGEGGMAVVYRVRHTTLYTVHALKVLQVESSRIAARLVEEGRVQARLRHPNIVAVTDVLEVGGRPALLMDFIGGGSLADRIAIVGALPAQELLPLFSGVVAGVGEAHSHGLVHRDLKPANILLDELPDGSVVPKVADFGIARHLEPGSADLQRTRAGASMGTPAFMAPEQIRDAASVDQRADIYALGAILYQMATGRRAFAGRDALEVLNAAALARFEDPRALGLPLPGPVVDAIMGCLRVDPGDRIPDAATLLQVLAGQGAELGFAAPEVAAPAAGSQTWGFELDGPDLDELAERLLAEREAGEALSQDAFGWSVGEEPAGTVEPVSLAEGSEASPASPPSAGPMRPAPSPPATPSRALGPPAPPSLRSERSQRPERPGPLRTEATGTARLSSATAMVTDGAGRGHAVEIVVELLPGQDGVWAPEGMERDARVAAQLAVAVALGPEARTHGVRWAVRGQGVQLHGSSIGLAVAVATRACFLEAPVPPGWGFTGGVDLDGRVASVGGVPAKVRAAHEAGLSHVAVPFDDSGTLPPVELEVVALSHVGEIFSRLLPEPILRQPRWRPSLWPLLLLLPALVGLTRLSDPFDLWLQHPLLVTLRGRLPLTEVVVVGLDEQDDMKTLRGSWPGLLRGLRDAGARAVFVDVWFLEPSEHDEEIADAVDELEASGVPVVLAARFTGAGVALPANERLASHPRMGLVETERDRVFGQVRRAPVRRATTRRTFWHAAALTVEGLNRSAPPRLEGRELVIGPTRTWSQDERVLLAPVELAEVLPWATPEAWGPVAGKAVVVGVYGGDLDLHQTPDGERYGAEIEAGLIQTLLSQRTLRELSPEVDALAALATGLATWGLGLLLGGWRRWLALLLPLGVLAVGAAMVQAGILLAPVPVLLAAAVAAGLLRGAGDPAS